MSTQSINALGCHGMRPPIPHLSWTHFILMMMVALPNKEHMRVPYTMPKAALPVETASSPELLAGPYISPLQTRLTSPVSSA